MRSIEPSPRGLIEIFRPQKRERHFLFHVKKQFTGGVFLSKKPASSLMEKGGIGLCRHSIPATPLSIRERDWTTRSLRFPRRHSPLFQYKRHHSLKDERGIGQDAHFVSAQSLPSWRREELDSAVIPFRQFLSRNKAFPFLNTREPFF